jgi:diguanylate cyclase (GGDEF)-like protein
MLVRLWHATTLRRDQPKLLRAQVEALKVRVPILYVLLITNAAAVAATHIGTAPLWLATYIPGFLSLVCIIRIFWWKKLKPSAISVNQACSILNRTTALAVVLTIVFGVWAIALYTYGNAYQQGQIAYFLVVAGISCVFCLIHLPAAAILTAAITFNAMIFTFLFSGNPVFIATALSVVFLSYSFYTVILSYYENFASLVDLTEDLEKKHTELEILNDINSYNSLHDQLTGLVNRRGFFEYLDSILRQQGSKPTVALVDLDGFKPVNDTFGHAAGDHVLKEAARRFREIIGTTGMAARLGGDEFGFVLPGAHDQETVATLANALCNALHAPFEIPDGTITISGSCGVVYSAPEIRTSEEIYNSADFALYQAKEKSRGGVEFFSQSHKEILGRNQAIEIALLSDQLSQELSLVYQPVLDLRTGKVTGFEALARWFSPVLGPVAPAEFIPLAERNGVINRITLLLLDQALDALKTIPADLHVSFNLSARDISDKNAAIAILAAVHTKAVNASRLDLEITETALLSNFETCSENIHLLRSAGISISLDDFGIGFSSLSHIHQFEFDKLKIDQSFVMDITSHVKSHNIIRSIASLCKGLKIISVAEGIETAEAFATIKALGVRHGQGYYFSKPLKLDDAIRFAKQRQGVENAA